jgi:hypothetical protein
VTKELLHDNIVNKDQRPFKNKKKERKKKRERRDDRQSNYSSTPNCKLF